jgi:hypothetical protein
MNERLKELAKQARLPACHASHPKALERFAELIRQDEREACALLIEHADIKHENVILNFLSKMFAQLAFEIRARGKE